MTTHSTDVIRIVDFLCEYLEMDASVREEYSGRGMYGDTCSAIVVHGWYPLDPLVAVGYACGRLGIDLDSVPSRSDSMGLGIIVY